MSQLQQVSRAHYFSARYIIEHADLPEAEANYKNVGWSLGNACPLDCKQCYSKSARELGQNLTKKIVDRVVDQLTYLGVKTVNLGGNEPIYTNGLNPKDSLLPYILDSISKKGMLVGVTTSGITLVQLEKFFPDYLEKINDVDISIDSPRANEHDQNRGRSGIYKIAMQALEICKEHQIPRSFVMCAMNWNFTPERINEMIDMAVKHQANYRVNPIKPTEPKHMDLVLTPEQFYQGLMTILARCEPIDLSDPAWASSANIPSSIVSGCPCGITSFRIHSITPDGRIPISPCVYLHDYKYGDLRTMDIQEILNSPPFQAFRRRKANPEIIEGCQNCNQVSVCGGGCAARAYLHRLHEEVNEKRSLFVKDPYCPKDFTSKNQGQTYQAKIKKSEHALVHKGYLCTGIFSPKENSHG
ncbi:radical SAM protein [Candidatus Shapirobacteria bacterium]|nr:radical SAM protein [Candidatus Shapirobacteria bacterium]